VRVLDTPRARVYQGSCLDVLKGLPDASVEVCLTDPPYGFDPLAADGTERPGDWDNADARRDLSQAGDYHQRRANSVNYALGDARHDAASWGVDPVVGGYAQEKGLHQLPRYVMPPRALFNYQLWCGMWAAEVLRVLKPGGHLLASNAPKGYHRMATGIEDAGFETRDTIHWTYVQGHPTGVRPWQAIDRAAGFNPKDHGHVPQSEAAIALAGWHTGLKPSHELIGVFRKPLDGPVHRNLLAHGVGAYRVDAEALPDPQGGPARWPANTVLTHAPGATPGDVPAGSFHATAWDPIVYVPKPAPRERHGTVEGGRNIHPTVKPLALCAHLLGLTAAPGAVVLDPFAGSGTTGLAAIQGGYRAILIEREPRYCELILSRLSQAQLPLFGQEETPWSF
jgi:site-specific DNA-methyltransferase (adenine-specific)